MFVYSFDIGGSSIKHGIIEIEGKEASIESRGETVTLTNNDFANLKSEILRIINNVTNLQYNIDTIGISTTGSVDPFGIVINAGHFAGYSNISWNAIIKERHENIKIVNIINDGRAAAWGEYFSSGLGNKSHVHVAVGTGVGGGIIFSNEILLGDRGFSGYIGHMKVTLEDTIRCSCGRKGCVETLASAPAVTNFYQKRTSSIQPRSFNEIVELATAGDFIAVQAIMEAGYWLGIGIGNVLNILNPSLVTVGGGVPLAASRLTALNQGDLYFSSILKGAEQSAHKRVFANSDIKLAILGNDAGLIGAACLASLQKVAYT